MRKLFALILALCLLTSVLCVTAFAAEVPGDTNSIEITPGGRLPQKYGSMIGNGSLAVALSLGSLGVSVAALGFAIAANKKKSSDK